MRARTGGLLLGLALGACTMANPAFRGEGGATAGGSASSSGTGATGATAGTSAATGSGSGGETCAPQNLPEVDANLRVEGVDRGDCGQAEVRWAWFDGSPGPGTYDLSVCPDLPGQQGCDDSCASPGVLTIAAPDVSRPLSLPDCVRITMEREFDDGGPRCAFTGLVVSHFDESAVVPVFVASSKVIAPPANLSILGSSLSVEAQEIDTCVCPGCCDGKQSTYALSFSVLDLNVTLEPGDFSDETVKKSGTGTGTGGMELAYRVSNLNSREESVCGDPPEVHWTLGDLSFMQQ